MRACCSRRSAARLLTDRFIGGLNAFSAPGQKATSPIHQVQSALPQRADISAFATYVSKGP
jgi:hypothetical protein